MVSTDISTRNDIERLVSAFYQDVRADALLGDLFAQQIGEAWPDHEARVCDFWETVLLGGTRFKSRALLRHLDVDEVCPLCPFHFTHWCVLFQRAVETHFEGERATRATDRAQAMSHTLQLQLEKQRGGCPLVVSAV